MGADNDFEKLGELQDEQPPKDEAGKIDSAWVAWRRLQVDTMKWALAKKAPKYSDRYLLSAEIQHEHSFKSVSDSAAWIGQLIGSGQESAPTEHLPD